MADQSSLFIFTKKSVAARLAFTLIVPLTFNHATMKESTGRVSVMQWKRRPDENDPADPVNESGPRGSRSRCASRYVEAAQHSERLERGGQASGIWRTQQESLSTHRIQCL